MGTQARHGLILAAALLVAVLLASSFFRWKQEDRAATKSPQESSAVAMAVPTQIHSPPDALIGRVVDAETGKPIPQFRLMLQTWDVPKGATDDSPATAGRTIGPYPSGSRDGVFRLKGPPRGEWRLTIFAQNHEPFEARLVIGDSEARTTTPLPLRRGRSITGRMFDVADGSGIRGATVMFRDPKREGAHWRTPRIAQTTRDGWLIVDGVPVGALTVEAHADGYAPRHFSVPLSADDTAPSVDVSMTLAGGPRID